jgi:TRAP-type transport system periplasmic protein
VNSIVCRWFVWAALALSASGALAQQTPLLRGASPFGDDHPNNQSLLRFAELVPTYYGKPVLLRLHRNGELGQEADYFSQLSKGGSIDYAVATPSHMAGFAKSAPLLDMPFLWRDVEHWKKGLDADILKPIADEVLQKADVMIIGYAGGAVRNLVVNRPIRSLTELKGLTIRVMSAPIQTRIFQALTAQPTVIQNEEVYAAIRGKIVDALENEVDGVIQSKFYEVAPNYVLTQHAISVRPLVFSGKVFRRLDKDLQQAIVRAGREAGALGRKIESDANGIKIGALVREDKIKIIEFADRVQLMELVAQVKQAYAKEIGAEMILSSINAIK